VAVRATVARGYSTITTWSTPTRQVVLEAGKKLPGARRAPAPGKGLKACALGGRGTGRHYLAMTWSIENR